MSAVTTTFSWIITLLIIGAMVYYLPMMFIGMVIGYTICMNKDRFLSQDDIEQH